MSQADLPEDFGTPDDFVVPDDLSSLMDSMSDGGSAGDGGSRAQEGSVLDRRAPSDGGSASASGSAAGDAPAPYGASAPDAGSETDGASVPDGPEAPSIALIITQIAGAQALVAACALAKVPVDAFDTGVGSVASCRDLTPGGPDRAAAAISEMIKDIPVILIEARKGQLSASRWQLGKRQADLPAGLVLDGAPEELEDLLIGSTTLDQIDGVITSVGISRFKALRQLGALARRHKKS